MNLLLNTLSAGSKYVCKPDGSIAKHKVPLVAQGFTKVEGINFYDTYSPVAKLSSIRTVIPLDSMNEMHRRRIDVNTTYINATLDEDPRDFNLQRAKS
jgi:hypothetical protein